MSYSLCVDTVQKATRNGPKFVANFTNEDQTFVKVLNIYIQFYYEKCELINLASLQTISKAYFNFLDVNDVFVASVGFRIQNKSTNGYVSRLLLAQHLISLRRHPELTRTILGGLGQQKSENGKVALPLSTKKLNTIILMETGIDEAKYWKDRFLSLLHTSSVPTLSQWQDVACAYSYVTDPMSSNVPAVTPYDAVQMVLNETGTINSYFCSYIFHLSTFSKGVDRQGQPHVESLNVRRLRTKIKIYKQILEKKMTMAPQQIEHYKKTTQKATEELNAVLQTTAATLNNESNDNESKTETTTGTTLRTTPNLRQTPKNAYQLLTSVDAIKNTIGFLHNLTIDDLKEDKWNLKHDKDHKLSFPKNTKKSICLALCELSLHQLYDLNKDPGLWKSIVKSMSTNKIIQKVLINKNNVSDQTKLDKYSKLNLILIGLRKDKYPSSQKEWQERKWHKNVTVPLIKYCSTPKYECKDERWLSNDYQNELSNQRFHLPIRTSVESRLSLEGNTKSTWLSLLDSGRVSGNQILQNMRSLVLLNVPIHLLKTILVNEIKNQRITLMQLLKIDSLFTSSIFGKTGITTDIYEIIMLKEINENVSTSSSGENKEENKINDHVNVQFISMTFRDAKGNVSTQEKNKNVSKSFSMETCNEYRMMLNDLAMSVLDEDVTPIDPSIKCAIVYSHELAENLLRSGIPPIQPSYSDVSMWRGEALCLNSMGRAKLRTHTIQTPTTSATSTTSATPTTPTTSATPTDQLLVGITWRELPKSDPSNTRVDLDLTIILYDQDMNKLDFCSYSHLVCPGCKHSGDITTAPFSDGGAREEVLLDLAKLPKKTKYVGIVCYNFTGQPLDECCADASIFVADPVLVSIQAKERRANGAL